MLSHLLLNHILFAVFDVPCLTYKYMSTLVIYIRCLYGIYTYVRISLFHIGTPISRIPIMAKQPLDLFKLFKLVVERGGLLEVSRPFCGSVRERESKDKLTCSKDCSYCNFPARWCLATDVVAKRHNNIYLLRFM